MKAIKVQIDRYVDDSQPGWVECALVDVLGRRHLFVEKVPTVSSVSLDGGSSYPQPGVIACVVLGTRLRADGLSVLDVDTGAPWGVESTSGESRFELAAEQLVEWDDEVGPG